VAFTGDPVLADSQNHAGLIVCGLLLFYKQPWLSHFHVRFLVALSKADEIMQKLKLFDT